MKKSALAITMASLLSPISYLQAQEATVDETVVVTANRYQQSALDTTATISIVTKEDIASMQAQSIPDVLERLPGVQIIRSGGEGSQTDVFVRGSSSKHLLVLINGVRIGSATLGAADFSNIPLTGVERIELLRGARAAQYGSDAVAGVLNVITTAEYKETEGNVAVGGGSDGYRKLAASLQSGSDDGAWFKVAAEINGADGFSAQTDAVEADNDGYENYNVYAEVGGHLSPNWQISAQGLYHKGKSEYDDAYNPNSYPYSYSEQYNLAGKLAYDSQHLLSELTLATNLDKLDTRSSYPSVIKTNRYLANWFNHYQINDIWVIAGGLEWYQDKVENSSSTFDEDTRANTAVYLSTDLQLGSLGMEASVRGDDNDAYGERVTWQTGAAYHFSPELTVFSNIGSAFKAPTFNDLYYPFSGNPDLKPEESVNYEAGIRGNSALVGWSITGYRNDVENLIAWVPDSTGNWAPQNVGEARLQGIEVSGQFGTGVFNHDLSYDYLDAKDTQTDNQLAYRAKHVAKWNVSYEITNQWQTDLTTIYTGKSYSDDANTQEVDAYTLLDLGVTYFVTDSLTLRGKILNLLDKDYAVKPDYNTQGRAYYLNANYQF